MATLLVILRRIRRRVRMVRAVEAGLAGAIGGGGLAAVGTMLRIFVPQALPMAAAWPALPLALVPLGFVAAFLARLIMGVPLQDAALAADRAAGLKERLTTALEVLESREPGILDERLLAQAGDAAARLDVRQLPLAATLGRRTRILLVAVLVLALAALVPSVGGPPLAPQAAEQAAASLERLAQSGSVAPPLREAMEKAAGAMRAPGADQGAADQATAAVYQAAAQAEGARQKTLQELAKVKDENFEKMVRAAVQGDISAAGGAAKALADRLGAAPASGGMPVEERERLAASLAGAGVTAGKGNLKRLEEELAAAAKAVRKGGPAAGEALERLADGMAESLGEKAAGGVTAAVEAVGRARRTVGLPELPPPEVTRGLGRAPAEGKAPEGAAPSSAAGPSATGGAARGTESYPISPDVRPEDRDVVRRYFGG